MPDNNTQVSNESINALFDPLTLSRLNELARVKERSSSELVRDVIAQYLDYLDSIEELGLQVQKGREDIKARRVVSHEAVQDKFRALGVDVD